MTEWLVRVSGAILIGLMVAGMFWKLQRDRAAGVVRRADESGRSMSTLYRSSDPAAFRRHVVTQSFLIGLMLLVMLAVLFIPAR